MYISITIPPWYWHQYWCWYVGYAACINVWPVCFRRSTNLAMKPSNLQHYWLMQFLTSKHTKDTFSTSSSHNKPWRWWYFTVCRGYVPLAISMNKWSSLPRLDNVLICWNAYRLSLDMYIEPVRHICKKSYLYNRLLSIQTNSYLSSSLRYANVRDKALPQTPGNIFVMNIIFVHC